jgi:hypothetical protein
VGRTEVEGGLRFFSVQGLEQSVSRNGSSTRTQRCIDIGLIHNSAKIWSYNNNGDHRVLSTIDHLDSNQSVLCPIKSPCFRTKYHGKSKNSDVVSLHQNLPNLDLNVTRTYTVRTSGNILVCCAIQTGARRRFVASVEAVYIAQPSRLRSEDQLSSLS